MVHTVLFASIGIEADGMFINIPTVINGEAVSDRDAIQHYRKTGQHLGKFKTERERRCSRTCTLKSQSLMYGK